jgi:methyl-accepting chemotaxis protein
MRLAVRISLTAKLIVPVVVVAIVAALLTIFSSIKTDHSNLLAQETEVSGRKALLASELRAASRAVQRDLLNLTLDRNAESRKAMAEYAVRRIKLMSELGEKLMESLNEEERAKLRTLPKLNAELIEIFGKVRQIALSGETDQAYAVFSSDLRAKERSISALIDPFIDSQTKSAREIGAEMKNNAETTKTMLFWTSALGIAGSLLLAVLLVWRSIVRPMGAITKAMAELADRRWQTDIPALGRQDEIGAMAKALLVFRDNGLESDRLAAESEAAEQAREERRQHLDEAISEFQSRAAMVMSTVVSATNELQAAAESLADSAEETLQQSSSVAGSAEAATANVQSVAAAGEQLSASIAEILRQAQHSSDIATDAVTAAGQTDEKIQQLAQAAEKIGSVIELIQGIASQTNLLALNATIEAARAGEAGRGFAVVASEVKDLAGQTTRATNEIAMTIAGIQDVTKGAVEAMRTIGQKIEKIHVIAREIAGSVEEQGRATSEIAQSVQQAALGTTHVSSNISHVNEAATNTGAASTQVMSAARDLSEQAETLRMEMDKFLLAARAA